MPPLYGICAVDHGRVSAGPLLGMMMNDLGADLINVGSMGGDRGSTALDALLALRALSANL